MRTLANATAPSGKPPSRWRWPVRAVLFLGALYFAAYFVSGLLEGTDCWNGWSAWVSLRALAIGQEEFRKNDLDGNGVQDYWRRDIAGLYALAPKGTPLKLIESSIALADKRWEVDPTPYGALGPKSGYVYRTLRFSDEAAPSPDRFAAGAFPTCDDEYSFVVTNKGAVYCKKLGRPDYLEICPSDPPAEGWLTMEEIRTLRHRKRQPLWWLGF